MFLSVMSSATAVSANLAFGGARDEQWRGQVHILPNLKTQIITKITKEKEKDPQYHYLFNVIYFAICLIGIY